MDYCQACQLRVGFAEEVVNAAKKSAYKKDIFYIYLGGLFVGVYVCLCNHSRKWKFRVYRL